MTIYESFIQSIIKTPCSDTSRLVFADFLTENGNSDEQAWAEFIRLQCYLSGRSLDTKESIRAWQRAGKLQARHRAKWLQPLGLVDESVEFRRGFVACVTITAHKFLQIAATLTRKTPLEELSLISAKGRIQEIVASPHLSGITTLVLDNNSLGPKAAAALAASLNLSQVMKLSLSNNSIGDEGAVALATSPHLRQLRELVLYQNKIRSRGAVEIARSEVFRNLELLDLCGNRVGTAGAIALASSSTLANTVIELSADSVPREVLAALEATGRIRFCMS